MDFYSERIGAGAAHLRPHCDASAHARHDVRRPGKHRWHRFIGTAVVVIAAATMLAASDGAWAYGNDAVSDAPIGTATTSALEMQRSGAHTGQTLSMSGDQASAAYARYLKSFDAPIPAFFGSALKSDVGSQSGSTQNSQ